MKKIFLHPAFRILNLAYCILLSFIQLVHGQISSPDAMRYTWAGGLNSCQFCAMDLNLDGINDLIVFDRMGNRVLTFINEGVSGQINYRYAPDYAKLLPDLHDWVITADYNCDGKMDIFTYGNGGVRVFRNTSSGSLSFHLQTDLLKSWYYNGYVGILVTLADYPAFSDIDGDGDLDMLTFFGLGSYVEYHKNLSIEKFGNCDSLDFRLTDHCWGKFKESEGGNKIILNAACPYKSADGPVTADGMVPPKHTGSTLLANDLNGDGLSDLLIGDVDFPNIVSLTNGGTRDSAMMVSMDTLFPSGDKSIRLFDFPALSYLDIDNDGVKDLLASPFDPAYYHAENKKSCWYYKNNGSNNNPDFVYQANDFLQSEMFDFGTASAAVPYDPDGDGICDIVCGNYGYYDSSAYYQGSLKSYFTSSLAWIKNTGTARAPRFELMTEDLAGASKLGALGLYPSFADMNNDGILDMLCGREDGSLVYFEGKGDSAGIPVFGHPQTNYQQIRSGAYSAPQLFDLDRDGLDDLIIGQQNGTMKYFRNTGSPGNPVFIFAIDTLGQVDVTNHELSYYGYCTPFFFRKNNRTYLMAGSEEGKLHLYSGIDGNISGKFKAIDSLNFMVGIPNDSLRIGWRASGFLSHLSDPLYYDLVCGNFSGGLNYFTRGKVPGVDERKPAPPPIGLKIYPNPATSEIRIEFCESPELRSRKGETYLLRICSVFGEVVFYSQYIPGTSIDIRALAGGIYFAELSRPAQSLVSRGKFLISR